MTHEIESLTKEAVTAYQEALANGSILKTPGGDGVPSPTAPPRSAVTELLRAGLLRDSVDNAEVWVPVDPETAAVQAERQARQAWADASRLQQDYAPLTAAYRSRRNWSTGDSQIRYVEGKAEIAQQAQALAAAAKSRVFTVQPGPRRPKDTLDHSLPADLALLRRGVHRRILYQSPARRHPDTREYVRALVEVGAEVRAADELYERVFIIDDTVIHPVDGNANVAVLVSEPATVAFHCLVFEQAWQRAQPFLEAPKPEEEAVEDGRAGDQLTAMQKLIVRLLINEELKHEAIAAATGLSLRTVRRQLEVVRSVFGNVETTPRLAWEIRGQYPEGLPADW
ncbi:hypothetical protein [Streptacidiphilus jiangxiensis]|uniref:HTH luxR-type domain-containing protein n=1 Tax=Streptacidiphilus jiangxiensis TaxID=235985 RepID=A0A1H7JLW9_STRJI|nr:hypothetical protein [Streptacidiphilus jiangxiensis]SEK74930.1 hypothetical protein SAMN05414137_103333 [Streptacidiphilus jiangxiensis]